MSIAHSFNDGFNMLANRWVAADQRTLNQHVSISKGSTGKSILAKLLTAGKRYDEVLKMGRLSVAQLTRSQ